MSTEFTQTAPRRPFAATEHTVLLMQETLLPADLPVLPGIDLAGRYLFADDGLSAGGDWFDAVPRADGRVALVVGDVLGHGIRAAATMGQLRAVVRERLRENVGLVEAATSAERYLADLGDGDDQATLCIADLDPRTGQVDYLTAGHPAPLLVGEGPADFLPLTGGAPLGARDAARRTRSARLGIGDVLVLYSDGLIERPRRSFQDSIDELREVAGVAVRGERPAGSCDRAVERACAIILERLVRSGGYRDDVTVLAAERQLPTAPLRHAVGSTERGADALRGSMDASARWLRDAHLRTADRVAAQHVVGELVTNAITHAYADRRPGPIELEMSIDPDGRIDIEVDDHGRWQEPTGARFQRGLRIVAGLADELRLDRRDDGTAVHARFRLTREADLLTALPSPGAAAAGVTTEFAVEADDANHTVRLRGPLDDYRADTLRDELTRLSDSGMRIAIVDVGALTHISSGAVRVLHEFTAPHREAILLVAPVDTTAHRVLEIAAVPHVSSA